MIAHSLEGPARPLRHRLEVLTGHSGGEGARRGRGRLLLVLGLVVVVGVVLAITLANHGAAAPGVSRNWSQFRQIMLAWMARSSKLG